MSVELENNVGYGLTAPLLDVPLLPILANRPPSFKDKAPIGTIWIYKAQNLAYILTSVVNNIASWELIVQGPNDFITETAQTIGAVPIVMTNFAMPPSSTITLSIQVIGTQDDFTHSYAALIFGAFRRGAAGGPIQVVQDPYSSGADLGTPATVAADLIPNGNNINLEVIGAAGQTWNWKAVLNGLTQ